MEKYCSLSQVCENKTAFYQKQISELKNFINEMIEKIEKYEKRGPLEEVVIPLSPLDSPRSDMSETEEFSIKNVKTEMNLISEIFGEK